MMIPSKFCQENPRTSKFVVVCSPHSPKTPVKNLIWLFLGLYLLSGVFGIIYMIFKVVPINDFFVGNVTASEIIQRMTHTEVCDNDWVDVWSVSHFLVHSLVVFIIYYFYPNDIFAVFGSIGFSFIWELIERGIVTFAYNFACESTGNTISDIIFGVFGAFLAYFILISHKNDG